jgi:putative nucleotidyltransferase with HDIG domain
MGLFLLCALVPIIILGVTAFVHVSGQLEDQTRQRLQSASTDAALALKERLRFVTLELDRVAVRLRDVPTGSERVALRAVVPPTGLASVVVERGEWAHQEPLLGAAIQTVDLTEAQRAHLTGGSALLTLRGAPYPDLLLATAVDPGMLDKGIVWASVDQAYLWEEGAHRRLPEGTEMCVYAGEGTVLSCPRLTKTFTSDASPDPRMAGMWGWEVGGEDYLAATGSVQLAHEYGTPSWTVVLAEPRSLAMAPLAEFRRSFPLVLLLAVMAVLGITHFQVRRSMEPLRALADATSRIARHEFDAEVTVASGDEFEELASSFNAMARRLGRQFKTLTAMSDIDRAALSHSNQQDVIRTILERTQEALGGSGVAVLMRDNPDPGSSWSLVAIRQDGHDQVPVEITPGELDELSAGQDVFRYPEGQSRRYLEAWSRADAYHLVLPLVRAGTLFGALAVEYQPGPGVTEAEERSARQLADQISIALANAALLQDLDALSTGALTALARTIDANSPWTAGHSERVTDVAMAIGRTLGLPAGELDTLYRGGLLHDIGKIAIPAAILNKPGKLTEDEYAIIKQHPATGARILSPIRAYRDTIPIVLSHHERIDGSGYPGGLRGEDIPFLARIMAAADVYDALSSPRPYRPGWTINRVVDHLHEGAGSHFDRDIVAALVESVRSGALPNETAGAVPTVDPVLPALGPLLPVASETPA